jgi:hypothetical protein
MKKILVVTTVVALSLGTSFSFSQPIPIIPVPTTFGVELAPSIVAANWTCGAGWDCSVAGTLNKNAGGTGTAAPTTALKIAIGTTYKVVITTGAVSVADGATYTLGGVAGSALSSAATFTDYIPATTTANLIITPTPTTTRFTITAISVVPVSGKLPTNYTATVSATQANTAVTFGCNAYSIRITDDGENEVFYEYKTRIATTSSVELHKSETETVTLTPAHGHIGWPGIGLICSSGETATVRVHAMCW